MSKFVIKDQVDRSIYASFNILSQLAFFFNFKVKKLIAKNAAYKDRHLGQSCYILGTGPSINNLNDSDIEKLKTEIIFGVNSLYKAPRLNAIVPSYYSLFDNYYWDPNSDFRFAFKEIAELYDPQPIFLTNYVAKASIDELGLDQQSLFLYSKLYPIKSIDTDLSRNMHITMNVVSTTILAAIYMGFKEIYLLGCDYNSFATPKTMHCYDDSDEFLEDPEGRLAFLLKFYHLTTEFHYLIAKLAKKRGVKVVNLTEGSLLDAYPRGNISNVLGRS